MIIGFHQPDRRTHFKCGHEKTPGNTIVKAQNNVVKWLCRLCRNEQERFRHSRSQ